MKAAHLFPLTLALPLALTACDALPFQQPDQSESRAAPSAPIDSPDITKAEWRRTKGALRLTYGDKARPPLVTMECLKDGKLRRIRITRHAHADEGAEAMMALIAGKHMVRVPIKAVAMEEVSLWQASYLAASAEMGIFMSGKDINLTIPGAGLVVLKASTAPSNLLRGCLGIKAPAPAISPVTAPAPPVPAADQG